MTWERTAGVGADVVEVEWTGSTNADLVAAVAAGDAAHLAVLVTRDQRSGRGRLDRVWQAPAGASLAVSVVLRVEEIPPAARGWIPLLAGTALAAAIGAQLPGRRVGVKWPNDVLADERKISGILAEGTTDPGAVVVGAGINTAMTSEQLPVPTATSFAALGAHAEEDRLLADYLGGLDAGLSALARAGGDAVRSGVHEAFRHACLTIGREVAVAMPDGSTLHGTAEAIDPSGRLQIRTAGGVRAVAAGDVVHVRPA